MLFCKNVAVFLIFILFLYLCRFYIFFIYKKRRFLKFAYNEKGFFLPILPQIGTMYVAIFTGTQINPLSIMDWMYKKIGLPCSLWVGTDYYYISMDADEIKTILNHSEGYGKADFYNKFRVFFKDTLLTVPYDQWKVRRRHFTKSFKPNMLKMYFPTFLEQSRQLIKEIEVQNNNECIFERFSKYTYTNFFLTHAGLDETSKFKDMNRLGVLLGSIQSEFGRIILDPLMTVRLYFKCLPKGKNIFEKLKEANTFIMGVIERKKKQMKEVKGYIENNKEVCLLDLVLNFQNNMFTQKQVYEEFGLFQGAATETTASSLAFTCILLGMYPEIQEKLYQEVRNALGDCDLTMEAVESLPYMEAVIFESLRLLPVIPLLGRKCSADIDLGGKILPKDSNFLIDIYHLHRNPKYWKNPLKFDPTRFLPENVKNIYPYSFIPFSNGPRDCIGKRQALILMKTTIANILRNFRIISNHKSILEFQLRSCVSIIVANKLHYEFIPRNRQN
ncbi:hypothetical protein ABEB36_008813 [Hypothenemus hampei]|uniref:Cytochrome P450 n=1 Tax=Hypothenemus hampei TaxID=57062 RepID=A0ABD1EN50_HYPHA